MKDTREKSTQEKKNSKRRVLIITVLVTLIVVSITSGTLAVYSQSERLFGNMTFLFPTPKPRAWDFDRTNPEEAAAVIYEAAGAFLGEGKGDGKSFGTLDKKDQNVSEDFFEFVGWDFTDPAGVEGGRSKYEVYLAENGVWYTEYTVNGKTSYYPSQKPSDVDTRNLSYKAWLAYMVGEDSAVYKYFFPSRDKQGITLDSDGRNFAPAGKQQALAMIDKLGGDSTQAMGWRIWLDKNSDSWNIFWTSSDLSNMNKGDALPYVWRYNSKTDIIEEGESVVQTKSLTENGNTYIIHEISGGSFKLVDHPEPSLDPNATPAPDEELAPLAGIEGESFVPGAGAEQPQQGETPSESATQPEAPAEPQPEAPAEEQPQA